MPSKPDALAQDPRLEASPSELVRRRNSVNRHLAGPGRKAAIVWEGEPERPASEPAATTL